MTQSSTFLNYLPFIEDCSSSMVNLSLEWFCVVEQTFLWTSNCLLTLQVIISQNVMQCNLTMTFMVNKREWL